MKKKENICGLFLTRSSLFINLKNIKLWCNSYDPKIWEFKNNKSLYQFYVTLGKIDTHTPKKKTSEKKYCLMWWRWNGTVQQFLEQDWDGSTTVSQFQLYHLSSVWLREITYCLRTHFLTYKMASSLHWSICGDG